MQLDNEERKKEREKGFCLLCSEDLRLDAFFKSYAFCRCREDLIHTRYTERYPGAPADLSNEKYWLFARASYNGAIGRLISATPGPPIDYGFYKSKDWLKLRSKFFHENKDKRYCVICGARPPEVTLHVDHIKPRNKHPELELDINNLQFLCRDCNIGKGDSHSIDWR